MHASQLDAGVFFPPGSDDGMTGSVRVKVIKLCNWAIKKKKIKDGIRQNAHVQYCEILKRTVSQICTVPYRR